MLQVADAVVEAKEYLCEADRNIGDGDHGIGMAGGFEGVKQELAGKEFDDVYLVLSTGCQDNDSHYGGLLGIIFGLLFYAGSKNMTAQKGDHDGRICGDL